MRKLKLVVIGVVGILGVGTLYSSYIDATQRTIYPNPDDSAFLIVRERPADSEGRVFAEVSLSATLFETELDTIGTYEARGAPPPEWIDAETVNICALAGASNVKRTVAVRKSDYDEARTFKVVSRCPGEALGA